MYAEALTKDGVRLAAIHATLGTGRLRLAAVRTHSIARLNVFATTFTMQLTSPVAGHYIPAPFEQARKNILSVREPGTAQCKLFGQMSNARRPCLLVVRDALR
jgi:hypothetical protein